ncbi:hypothetical protein BP6252_05412 [Coleophoma cylindrospora]|uniref:Uncharacterized protein n=1 Tax=Coleophoma cylindrospora TaxID=1849047 RepID=A0A3D8RTI2_9HELO|nr:hypothetical protein BP6252_05412 [Coleophoma cylindrospora]
MPPLVWLVTGCSSGFGEAFVHSIIARGDKVIATGRNAADRLGHLQATGAAILPLDVTAPKQDIEATVQKAILIHGTIDVLVNNAGYCELGFLEDIPPDKWMAQLNTNFFGCVNITQALLPHFRSKKSGTIVFMSSIWTWTSGPGIGPYGVSKHALASPSSSHSLIAVSLLWPAYDIADATQGYAGTLQAEVSQFNIHPILFDIGHFRSSITSPTSVSFTPPSASTADDYNSLFTSLTAAAAQLHGNQPGDPRKCTELILDVVRGEGLAKGLERPARIPVGKDAVQVVKDACQSMLETVGDWERVVSGTDF